MLVFAKCEQKSDINSKKSYEFAVGIVIGIRITTGLSTENYFVLLVIQGLWESPGVRKVCWSPSETLRGSAKMWTPTNTCLRCGSNDICKMCKTKTIIFMKCVKNDVCANRSY